MSSSHELPAANWNLAEAKSKLSEVLNLAEQQAQIITRRDREYVVLDGEQYQRLTGNTPGLKQVILDGPSLEGVDLDRDPSGPREVEL